MSLDPIERMMLRRLANFFAENANYDTYNTQDWYHRSKFWDNIGKMVGREKSVNSEALMPDSYHYDPPTEIFDILEEVYLTSPQRFYELTEIVLGKMNLKKIVKVADIYDNKRTMIVTDEHKISALNRYLSVFHIIVDEDGHVTSSTGLTGSRTVDRKLILDFLDKYPSEKASFLGAIDTFAQGGSDSFRQSLSSCRTLVDNLLRRLSGESDWTKALPKIVDGDKKRDLVKSLHHFLSGYGVHGDKIPSQSDAELGLKLTEDTIVWIIKSYRSRAIP